MLWIGRFVLPAAAKSADDSIALGCRGPIAHFGLMASALMATAALAFAYAVMRRYVQPRHAVVGVLIAGFASPLFWYAAVATSYNHATSAFTAAVLIWFWHREVAKQTYLRWLLIGFLVGLCALVRAQSATIAIVPALELLTRFASQIRSRRGCDAAVTTTHAVVAALAALLAYAPQLYVHRKMFGSFSDAHISSGYLFWTQPDFAGPLVFPFSGLLSNSPLLYLSLLGLVIAAVRRREANSALSRRLFVAFFVSTYVIACA